MKTALTVDSASFTSEYDEFFKKYSEKYFGASFDWKWFKAQAIAESRLDPNAVSWCGAKGIMQIMPGTFAEINNANPWIESVNDPEQNIAAGIYYDKKMFQIWVSPRPPFDRLAFMFGAYNAGAGHILKAQKLCTSNPNLWKSIVEVSKFVTGWNCLETIGYVAKIMALMSVKI